VWAQKDETPITIPDTGGKLTKVGSTAAQFLKIGVGARAVAMGNGFVALADDITAMYWNPAGLARLDRNEAVFTHNEWLAGTSFDYAAVVLQLGNMGALGASLTTLTMGDMIVRTVDQPNGTGQLFTASDLALSVSYSRMLTDRFSIGFNAKYITQKIWNSSASSFALDVGVLFDTPFWGTRFGASLSNFGQDMRLSGRDILINNYDPYPNSGNVDRVNVNYDVNDYSLPLSFRVGISRDFRQGDFSTVTFAVDAVTPNDNTEYINAGIEYSLRNLIFLRGGYSAMFQRDSEQGFTFGAGLHYDLMGAVTLRLDYAYADFGRLQNAQRFTASLAF
jgi:opacity protein-like surface antigen